MTLFDQLTSARIVDLAQPYFPGMPHYPTHPPFLFGMTKLHGDTVLPGGASSAADAIALGTHVGTHIDGLGHFSCNGILHGGAKAADVQSHTGGLQRHSIDMVAPIVRRGVLLDIAGLEGGPLPEDFEIKPAHLDAAVRTEIRPGDVVLLRTGWAQFFRDPVRFIRGVRGPGPAIDGARWLSDRGIFAAGSDTVAFERVPSNDMAVHIHLLVERGIHLIECLNLEQLAAEGVTEFVFVAAPLRIEGATGAPVRPFALLPETRA